MFIGFIISVIINFIPSGTQEEELHTNNTLESDSQELQSIKIEQKDNWQI